jgi:peroxiredoxin
MKRYLTVMAIMVVTGAFWALPCLGHEGDHPGAVSHPQAQDEVRFLDFSLADLDGAPKSLGRFVGKKPVLLVFWAAWCPLCKEQVPVINRIHRQGAVEVVAVNVKESPKKVKAAVRSLDIRYPVLLDPDGSVAKKYNVPGVPVYIVINNAGMIVYNGNSFPDRIEKYDGSVSLRSAAFTRRSVHAREHACGCSGDHLGRHACCCVPCHGGSHRRPHGQAERTGEKCLCIPLSSGDSAVSTHLMERPEFLSASVRNFSPVDRNGWFVHPSSIVTEGRFVEPPDPPPRPPVSC